MDGTLDHVMMRVADLDDSLSWYRSHLDYEEKDRWEADTFTIVYLGPEDMHEAGAMLELTHNHDGAPEEMGDAWGHIAVRVEDVYDAYEELMAEGVEDYRDPDSCGGRYAFVKDPDGHEVEIVQRDHGARWSLDHTMIRVEDADEALGFWTRKFEHVPTRRWESDTFANYFTEPRNAPVEAMSVELTYNYDGRSYTMGDAWGHLCVRVDDLHEDWERLMEREADDYRDPASCDDMYAFTKDGDGHEIELIERDSLEPPLFPE
ncbi:glyoxalase [Haloplanus rubicundus]|uniref:Glyoxalase n=1 Tax=Haloplanus rubicundus TaxID=1547898 RepID=A0A345ED27_9EURY|nr:VOC family protein [Haloplanus rubicundus]AXG06723.1 glyoxalase [Haloplanus rubicundus]AXG10099.1 glyoxalase [Haloplanus rubicundus]